MVEYFYIDKAWFILLEYIHFQNTKICNTVNPRANLECTLHPEKVGSWKAIFQNKTKTYIIEILDHTIYWKDIIQILSLSIDRSRQRKCDIITAYIQ